MTDTGNPIPPIPDPPKAPQAEQAPQVPPTPQAPQGTSSPDAQEFVEALKHAVEFLKMDFTHIEKVANDPKMPIWVIVILAISGVASAIGTLNIVGVVINPILTILFGSIFIAIFWVIAGPMLGGKASIVQHYNTMGLLAVVQWISVIPIIGPIISFIVFFYMIFVYQKLFKVLHGLSDGKAWIVVLIPIAVMFVIGFLFVAIFGLALAGLFSAAAAGG